MAGFAPSPPVCLPASCYPFSPLKTRPTRALSGFVSVPCDAYIDKLDLLGSQFDLDPLPAAPAKRLSCPFPGLLPPLSVFTDATLEGITWSVDTSLQAALPHAVGACFTYSPPRLYPRKAASTLSIRSSVSLASTLVGTPAADATDSTGVTKGSTVADPSVASPHHGMSPCELACATRKRKRRVSHQATAQLPPVSQRLSFIYDDTVSQLRITGLEPVAAPIVSETPAKRRGCLDPPSFACHPASLPPCPCAVPTRALRALLDRAPRHTVDAHFLDNHDTSAPARLSSLDPTVRLGLVNRIVQINDHTNLQYHSETVYIAINYMDRYFDAIHRRRCAGQSSAWTRAAPTHTSARPPLAVEPIPSFGTWPDRVAIAEQITMPANCRSRLSSYGATFDQQLIAVTCLYLAAKFCEDGYTPAASDFAQFLGMYDCTLDDIVAAEKHVLDLLEWNMFVVTPHAIAEELLKCLACPCQAFDKSTSATPTRPAAPVAVDYPSPCESSPRSPVHLTSVITPTTSPPSAVTPSARHPYPNASVFPSPCSQPDRPTLRQSTEPSPALFDESLEFWKLTLLDHTNVGLPPTLVALTGLSKASQCIDQPFSLEDALALTGVAFSELQGCLATFDDDFFTDDEEEEGETMDET
ncbi:hypothetical protein IWQ60_007143 [Tieghemiomyces parasiticus]|uniref:Cyclin N-terminal domain-containing protein n=1 Tax=Tieghemiomyces parasiticus TaxID=78921 RepID=A0A9W8A8U8_9FUNG|nr:hypothetical protein IWQ60_007143 [Tieghemiomyces parasiticus]